MNENGSRSRWRLRLHEVIFWSIVTLTTVGYGDIFPKTNLGQLLSAVIMIIGYAIIAVPTGIVTVELAQAFQRKISTPVLPGMQRRRARQ